MSEPVTWSSRHLEWGDRAERALAVALQRSRFQVTIDEMEQAWDDANPDHPMPLWVHGRWRWALTPAISHGRVTFVRAQGRVYYVSSDATTRELPPAAKSPQWGQHHPRVWALCEMAERALALAVSRQGTMVRGTAILSAWCEANGADRPDGLRGVTFVLKPALQIGRVRKVKQDGHLYYGPGDQPDLPLPGPPSLLAQLVEAVRRVATRMNSPVPTELVLQELESAFGLPKCPKILLTGKLSSLAAMGRLRTVFFRGRDQRGAVYYTLPSGPHRIHVAVLTDIDRCLHAVQCFWRACGGRPFTTRALHRYARARPSLTLKKGGGSYWCLHLMRLAKAGKVESIRTRHLRALRWAYKPDWDQLDEREREERLYDPLRSPVRRPAPEAASSGADDSRSMHAPTAAGKREAGYDACEISWNQNLCALILLAKQRAADAAPPGYAEVVSTRPVTRAAVEEIAHVRPELRPETPRPMDRLLSAATQRSGPRQLYTVTSFGHVGAIGYYDVLPSTQGLAYVTYLNALRNVDRDTSARDVAELSAAQRTHSGGIQSISSAIIIARADDLQARISALEGNLREAMSRARLLPPEVADGEARLRNFGHLTDKLSVLRPELPESPSARSSTERPVQSPHVSFGHVSTTLEGLDGCNWDRPDALHRSLSLVRAVRIPLGTSDETDEWAGLSRTGRAHVYFDRISLLLYVLTRWGGARLSLVAAQVRHVVGTLRDAEPLSWTLESCSPRTHVAAAAALGLFDDEYSRDSLTRYIDRALKGSTATVQVPAVEASVFGLARLPCFGVADSLREHERDALDTVAAQGADARLRASAKRVLASWDEGWDRDRLLYL